MVERVKYMLPALKQDSPKCLYLNQNKWIALARAANGLDDGRLLPALDAVKRAVAIGSVIVPLADIHILETLAPGGLDRRRRLAATMVEISKNYAIRPARIVQEPELSCAVAETLGLSLDYATRRHVIVKGLLHALTGGIDVTGDAAQAARLEAHVISPEFTVEMLTDEKMRTSTSFVRKRETIEAEEQDGRNTEALATLSEEQLLQIDVLSLLRRDAVLERISRTLTLLNVPAATINPYLASFQQHLQFIRRVPTLDVLLTLSQERYKNPGRRTHRNDQKDIGFLRVAIPYANFVVTERYWSHASNHTGLAEKYKTIVTTRLEELPELLGSNECLGKEAK